MGARWSLPSHAKPSPFAPSAFFLARRSDGIPLVADGSGDGGGNSVAVPSRRALSIRRASAELELAWDRPSVV